MMLKLLCAATFVAVLSGEAVFPPFESWRSAVVSGNEKALEELYSRRPPARSIHGKAEAPNVAEECRFWTSLKSAGLSNINPKLLSVKMANGQAQLVLRIDAKAADKNGQIQNVVASVAQLWVQQLDGWHLAITQSSEFGVETARTLPESIKPNPSLYPPTDQAREDLKLALATAAHEGKRVLVVFGANWCYDCHVLDSTFHSAAFAALVTHNYVVLHINIGDEGKDNNDMAREFGVGLEKGVPNLAVLEANGHVLVAQRGEFQKTTKIGPTDVRAFLEKWRPKRMT